MFNDENNRSDALGQRLQKIGGQMNPSPALKKAAKTGVPLRSAGIRYTAGTHVRKFTKAVLLYAAGIALFLGTILMIPKWFGGNGPVAESGSSDRCNHKYVALTMGLAPSCTEGTIHVYRCQYCGHSYSEQDPAPGHNIVDGVCTRCGEKEAETPSLSLDQFGDPAVINSVLNRMGLQFDKFANETPGEVKDFLGRGEVDGFLVTYYYTCEKLSPMELYYSFGEKRRMTNDDIASLKPGQPTQAELAADWYCFTGKDALALLTQYAAVEPTWSDQLRAMLLAYGYYYDADTDTFYNCAIDPSCMLAYGIHVTGCAQMKSGELVVFYATFEGEKRMVILKSDGDNYRFAGNCPTDYLYRDGTEPMCEHGQNPIDCPYCLCDEHVWITSENTATCTEGCRFVSTCTKCGYSFEEWLDAIPHEYVNGECTMCGGKHTHEYEIVTSDEQLCLHGLITVNTCKYCDDSYTHQTPAPGHDYQNGICSRCGTAKAESPVIDPNVTAGSQSLLPYQMYQIYPKVSADRFTALHPDAAPYYYNIYTYFGGYTITDIRLPVLSAKKGDTLTVSVIQTTNGFNEETPLATYKLTATRAISGEWVLFSGLSIEVPEGYTLTFGAMGDTLCVSDITEAADPLPDYFYCNDYRGLCGEQMLIIDVYGKKTP